MTIFDSNVWIALFHESDTLHKRARGALEKHQHPYGIPEYVLLEVTTILAQKAGMDHAHRFVDMVFDNRDCVVMVGDEQFCRSVARLFVEEERRGLSFVDMSLVFLAGRHTVVTFDDRLARRLKKV